MLHRGSDPEGSSFFMDGGSSRHYLSLPFLQFLSARPTVRSPVAPTSAEKKTQRRELVSPPAAPPLQKAQIRELWRGHRTVPAGAQGRESPGAQPCPRDDGRPGGKVGYLSKSEVKTLSIFLNQQSARHNGGGTKRLMKMVRAEQALSLIHI